MSPKPGSPALPDAPSPALPGAPVPAVSEPAPAPPWPALEAPAEPPLGMPPDAPAPPVELGPPELPPAGPPELPLDPPALELLEPELPLDPPALELLAPELPLLELDPLATPPLGDEAPELEEVDGGVGTEGVVGVLAEGQPASSNKTPTNANANKGFRGLLARERAAFFIGVVLPCCQF
jgi:hypothetical protein